MSRPSYLEFGPGSPARGTPKNGGYGITPSKNSRTTRKSWFGWGSSSKSQLRQESSRESGAPDHYGYNSPGNVSTGAQQQAVASAMSEWGWLGSNNAAPRTREVRLLPRKKQSLGLQLSTQKAPAGNDYVHFVQIVVPGSVADIAGLRVGEQLVTISGTVLRASNHKQLMSILKQTRKQRRAITVGLAASSDRPPSVGGAINTPGGTSLAHNSGLTGRTGSGGSGANGERAPQIFLPPGSMGASTHGRSAWHDTPNNVEFGESNIDSPRYQVHRNGLGGDPAGFWGSPANRVTSPNQPGHGALSPGQHKRCLAPLRDGHLYEAEILEYAPSGRMAKVEFTDSKQQMVIPTRSLKFPLREMLNIAEGDIDVDDALLEGFDDDDDDDDGEPTSTRFVSRISSTGTVALSARSLSQNSAPPMPSFDEPLDDVNDSDSDELDIDQYVGFDASKIANVDGRRPSTMSTISSSSTEAYVQKLSDKFSDGVAPSASTQEVTVPDAVPDAITFAPTRKLDSSDMDGFDAFDAADIVVNTPEPEPSSTFVSPVGYGVGERTLFSGYLNKSPLIESVDEETTKRWHSRWFVLTPSKLRYFVDESKAEMKGQIGIADATVLTTVDSANKSFIFALQTERRRYFLQANNDVNRIEWVRSIVHAIDPNVELDESGNYPENPEPEPMLLRRDSSSMPVVEVAPEPEPEDEPEDVFVLQDSPPTKKKSSGRRMSAQLHDRALKNWKHSGSKLRTVMALGRVEAKIEGKKAGSKKVGITVKEKDGEIVISKVGGLAATSGDLRAGQVVQEINGLNVAGQSKSYVMGLLKKAEQIALVLHDPQLEEMQLALQEAEAIKAEAAKKQTAKKKKQAAEAAKAATPAPAEPTLPLVIGFSIGDRVQVKARGKGIVRFAGPDHITGEARIGVQLDLPCGTCDGRVGEHRYFQCDPSRGVVVPPGSAKLAGFVRGASAVFEHDEEDGAVPATLSPDPEPEPQTMTTGQRAPIAPVVVDQSRSGDAQAVLDEFNAGDSLPEVLDAFDRLRNLLGVERTGNLDFYRTLQAHIIPSVNHKAGKVFRDIEAKLKRLETNSFTANEMTGVKAVIVGGGPVGLRAAVEFAMHGADVTLIEMRSGFSRLNILHLWDWLCNDLTSLGCSNKEILGKSFYHVGTRRLQLILLRMAAILGVKIYSGVKYVGVQPPSGKETTYSIKVQTSEGYNVGVGNTIEANLLLEAGGAGGPVMRSLNMTSKKTKVSTALGLVVHFKRDHGDTMDEFSYSKQFKQKMFADLREMGCDIENCVYYQGETHYFVMTPTIGSLAQCGAIKNPRMDSQKMVSADNLDYNKMKVYARKIATYFGLAKSAVFVDGRQACQLFDFSTRSLANESSKMLKHNGASLYCSILGDALIEPFWPEGLGVNRGFLSIMDTAFVVQKYYSNGAVEPARENHMLASRQELFELQRGLNGKTAKAVLKDDFRGYTVHPATRYKHFHNARRGSSVINAPEDLPAAVAQPAIQEEPELTTPAVSPTKASSSPKKGSGRQQRRASRSKDKEVKKKLDIGAPSNFMHLNHVGADGPGAVGSGAIASAKPIRSHNQPHGHNDHRAGTHNHAATPTPKLGGAIARAKMEGKTNVAASFRVKNRSASTNHSELQKMMNTFCDGDDLAELLNAFDSVLGEVGVARSHGGHFFDELKSKVINSVDFHAGKVFRDVEAKQTLMKGMVSSMTGVKAVIVGAGPVGLRAAVEFAMHGADVTLIEMRPDFSRLNILHLWDWLCTDLTSLGCSNKELLGKSFFHVGTRRLQLILSRICCILGVKFYTGVKFTGVGQPSGGGMYTINVAKSDGFNAGCGTSLDANLLLEAGGASGPVSHHLNMKQKETRVNTALGLVVHFKRGASAADAMDEFSFSSQFKQKEFAQLREMGCDIENCVYYQGETHYFVMTPTIGSLAQCGAIRNPQAGGGDPQKVVKADNLDYGKMKVFARKIAEFFGLTSGAEFVEGRQACQLFDFSTRSVAEVPSKLMRSGNSVLYTSILGDALIEPFWPEGLGVNRGFLSILDTAFCVREYYGDGQVAVADEKTLLNTRQELFDIQRGLHGKSKSAVLKSAFREYTVDPSTRYIHFRDHKAPKRVRRLSEVAADVIKSSPAKMAGGRKSVSNDLLNIEETAGKAAAAAKARFSQPHNAQPEPRAELKTIHAARRQSDQKSSTLPRNAPLSGAPKEEPAPTKSPFGGRTKGGASFVAKPTQKCAVCTKTVYAMEKIEADMKCYHKTCFRCSECNKQVSAGSYAALEGKIFCKPHFMQLFKLKGNYDEGFGKGQHKHKWDKSDGQDSPESRASQQSTPQPKQRGRRRSSSQTSQEGGQSQQSGGQTRRKISSLFTKTPSNSQHKDDGVRRRGTAQMG